MSMIWHIATVSAVAERRAIRGLRENGFTVVQPCFTVWKAVPKGMRERIKAPMFPGYLFLGSVSDDLSKIHDPRTPVHIIPTGRPQASLSRVICDFAFRELAGEFDKTAGEDRHYTPKPVTGPLTRTLGTGLTCLAELMKRDDNGRLDLLTSGELFGDDVERDDLDLAA